MAFTSGLEKIVRTGEVLAPHTWFKLGGPAEYFAEPTTVDELATLLARARDEGCPRTTLICFEANTRALAFYRRRGYHELDRRPIVPHPTLRYREGDAVLLAREV